MNAFKMSTVITILYCKDAGKAGEGGRERGGVEGAGRIC
jgi:hypothetical protein